MTVNGQSDEKMTESLDETDRNLLNLLGRNARAPVTELARRLGVARTTVQARIERLERSGVIRGYTVRAAEGAVRPIRSYVLIQVEPRRTAAVVAALLRIPEMESLHTTSGRFDMAAQIAAPDTATLDAALDRIAAVEGVTGVETLIQLTTKVDRRW